MWLPTLNESYYVPQLGAEEDEERLFGLQSWVLRLRQGVGLRVWVQGPGVQGFHYVSTAYPGSLISAVLTCNFADLLVVRMSRNFIEGLNG